MTKNRIVFALNGAPLRTAACAVALVLAACGGGGSSGTPVTETPLDRLGALRERADTLTMTGLHARWSLSAEGEDDIDDAFVGGVTCSGGRCTAADGTALTARNLLDLSGDGIDPGTAEAGARDGFDTVRAAGGFAVAETLPDLTVTVSPRATTWGFWGAHGFAALTIGTGPLSVEIDGTTMSGTFSLARAWAAGTAAGGNPTGTGRATWTGIAEASPTGTFKRVAGTVTVTIEDLSQPRVDVGIALDGAGAPLRWTGMTLAEGRFAAGTAGTDRLEGRFHGPAHEEAYGVFDTAHAGSAPSAPGARRERRRDGARAGRFRSPCGPVSAASAGDSRPAWLPGVGTVATPERRDRVDIGGSPSAARPFPTSPPKAWRRCMVCARPRRRGPGRGGDDRRRVPSPAHRRPGRR